MEGSLGFLFLAFLIIPLPNFFIFCTGLLSELRCIHTERQALLNFKQHLIDSSNRLSSWTAHGDCCHWEGVVCHNLTAHVQELHLRTSYPKGGLYTEEQYDAWERTKFGDSISLGGRGVWKKEEEYVYKTKGCVKTVMVEPITGLGYVGSFIMFAKATTAQPSFAPLPE